MVNRKEKKGKISNWIIKPVIILAISSSMICFLLNLAQAGEQKNHSGSELSKYEVYFLLCASEIWGDGMYTSFAYSDSSLSDQAIAEVKQKDREDIPSPFAYIKGPEVEMIFGPGPREETHWRHGEHRKGRFDFIDQKKLLASIGVSAENIKTVVITSTGYAWAGGIDAFPNATFVIQKEEFDMPAPYSERSDIVRIIYLEKEGRLRIIEGDKELAPGITAHFIGGKTHGTQSLSVRMRDGLVLLAGDAVWTYENLKYNLPVAYNISMRGQLKAYKRIREILGNSDALFVPGADMEVFRRFPKVSDRVVQIKLK